MPLLPQNVWDVDGRVRFRVIATSDDMLMHLVRILAIALSRLRMTVEETIDAFVIILDAMYGKPRNVVPLATKYSHSDLEAALASMTRKYCKQHECGLCDEDHHFWWDTTGLEDLGNAPDDIGSFNTLRTRPSMESKLRVFERQTPGYHLCQT